MSRLEHDEAFASWVEAADTLDEPEARERLLYSVALYHEQMAYGGPEEGGWWYDAGELLDRPVRYFRSYDAALAYCGRWNLLLHRLINSKQRYRYSDVLSEGQLTAVVTVGHPPKHYPATRPHYE
jgi:hypothetical protein